MGCLLGSVPPALVQRIKPSVLPFPSRITLRHHPGRDHTGLWLLLCFLTYKQFSLLKVKAGLVTSSGFHFIVLSCIPHSWMCGQCVIYNCKRGSIKVLYCARMQVTSQPKKLSTSVLPSTPSLSGVHMSAGISVFVPDLDGGVEQIWALDDSSCGATRNSPAWVVPSEKCF